jgi:hypothetical protein
MPGLEIFDVDGLDVLDKTLTDPTIQGTVSAGTGLTMPAFTAGGDISLGAYRLKTDDLLLKQTSASALAVRNVADTADQAIRVLELSFAAVATGYITGRNVDGTTVLFRIRDSGVGLVEVARLQGADDPYFALGGSQEFKFYNSGYADCGGNEFKNLKHILKNETSAAASPAATAATYGTAVDVNPATGYYGIVPRSIKLTAGGTFGATETLTARVTATYDDATTAAVTHDFTATGDYTLTEAEVNSLIADGKAITKFSVDCESSDASSTATASVTIVGRNT